jgi:hypothetical protein
MTGLLMEPGTQVRDPDGLIGVVIRPEDSCWQRTLHHKVRTICADPLEGHVLVRLDEPIHTIRDYWYRPEDLEACS